MNDQSSNAGPIPPDGFYICRMIGDTGGEVTRYVRVQDGIPYLPSGHAVLPSACSHFRPLHSWEICGAWPNIAGREMDAMRTANAGLVDRVRRLESAIRAMHGSIHGGRFAAMTADEIISGKEAL